MASLPARPKVAARRGRSYQRCRTRALAHACTRACTLAHVQAANERAKANISGLQQRRQQLRAELQQLREGFVASCAQLDSQTYALLQQLRARLTSSGAGIAAAVPLLAASGAAGQDGGGERDQQQQQAGGHAANDACQAQQLQHEEGCGAAVMEV